MKKIGLTIYLISIMIISLSLTNIFYIVNDSKILNLELMISGILFLAFHLFYYKFYNYLLEIKKTSISKALLISSIIGGVISIVIIIKALVYSGPNEFSKILGMREAVVPFLILIILVSLISAIICFFIQLNASEAKKSKLKILFATSIFYLLNLIMAIIIFFLTLYIKLILDLGGSW